jgi:hypothetical protein
MLLLVSSDVCGTHIKVLYACITPRNKNVSNSVVVRIMVIYPNLTLMLQEFTFDLRVLFSGMPLTKLNIFKAECRKLCARFRARWANVYLQR